MKWVPACFALAAIFVLAGCTPAEPRRSTLVVPPLDQCAAAGGTIRVVGYASTRMCVIRNKDAGKVCTDSSQCIGRCLVEGEDRPLKRFAPATGTCEPDNTDGACYAEVVRGRLTGEICVD